MNYTLTPEGRVHSEGIITANNNRRNIGGYVVAYYGNVCLPSGTGSLTRVGEGFIPGRLFVMNPKYVWDEKLIPSIYRLEDNIPDFQLPKIGDVYRQRHTESLVAVYAGLARCLIGETRKIASYLIIYRAALNDRMEDHQKVHARNTLFGIDAGEFLNPQNFDPIYNQNVQTN